MTTQVVKAQFRLNTGEIMTMQSTLTDDTVGELKTSGVVGAGGGLAATSAGTYANGKSITSVIQPVSSEGFITYAYINRRGSIAAILPIGDAEVVCQPLAMNFQLQAGDTVSVLTQATTAKKRACTLNVITSGGTQAIFSVTPTGAATNSMTHILTGQSLGESLNGQTVAAHSSTSIESSLYAGGSVLYVNDRGLPAGSCITTNVNDVPLKMNMGGLSTIQLNWQAQVITSA
jgi:hypothetical protein